MSPLLVKAFAFLAVTPSEPLMKIATFNVNNLNKRLVNLLDWLRASRPDVACLQELKATDSQFPIAAIERAGYCAVWCGQKSWNGVAILARDCQPVFTHTDLPGDPADTHSRYIEKAAINGVLIATLYAPNGNPQPGPKFKYKLARQNVARAASCDPGICCRMRLQNAKAPGFEADDFLAAAAAKEEKRGGTVLIASGDRDTFQLASDRTTILYPIRAGQMSRVDLTTVRARYGVDPGQVPDFIALRGDPSDKLPGAPGIGATGAASLLRRYGSLEAALAAGRFPKMAESLRLFRSIATMNRKAPLPSLRSQKPTWHKASALAREWELNQLAGRLEALAAG
jgi:5'-3' exonuclease, C-terminal SAM fold/5'-3' exonuclease, N-terminal resolvase-like domain/Endonuclease/Exonuclease/phosphatase family